MDTQLKRALLKDLGPIIFRNLFSIVAIIIGGLSITLVILGNKRDGLFLGSVITINIIVGIIQEVRAKMALEKLQLSAKQKFNVKRNDKNLNIFAEDILPGDKIHLKLGDQVPVNAIVLNSNSLECNLALLTGESDNVSKSINDSLISGSIVVAGSASIKATNTEKDSYLYKMNADLKKYEASYSPIQRAILKFIKIMAIILLILGIIIIGRSLIIGESLLSGFVQIAALASTIIAEGLLLASTILFAYGAIRMAKQKVLLQQINAIENLGRMSVVCIDKTGTITEATPKYEKSILFKKSDQKYFSEILSTYIANESSQTAMMDAIKSTYSKYKILQVSKILSFSSVRKYSAMKLDKSNKAIIIGAAENFINHLNPADKKWALEKIDKYSNQAKRIIFVAEASMSSLDNPSSIKNIRPVGFVVFSNPLKSGSIDTIRALQDRGVQVVVISGDSPETVVAVADRAKIKHSNKIITGDQLKKLNPQAISELVYDQVIFARILPEQKQKIVEAIRLTKKDVAMIGDGANDAMAIKSANIGIAMFDGAPATRQIADAVLVNNSFSAIPKGIKLSDTIITTLEMIGCLFFTRVWSGIFLLLITLLIKIDYPLLPRNITLLNIFIVTLPIILWLTYPRHRNRNLNDPSYLSRTLPFSIANALIIAIASLASILLIQNLGTEQNQIPMSVFVIFFIMSIYSIGLIPRAMGTEEDKSQQRIIYLGYIVAAAILVTIYLIQPLAKFFSLSQIDLKPLVLAIAIGYLGTAIQYIFVKFSLANKFWNAVKRT